MTPDLLFLDADFFRQAPWRSQYGATPPWSTAGVEPDRPFGKGAAEKSCIFLWLCGGPSHLDTWDLKPDAPEDIRGPYRPIATRVPGMQICELAPSWPR